MGFRWLAVIAAAICLSGCAGIARVSTYHGFADAKVIVGKRHFSVWLHRHDETALVQRGFGSGMGQAMASGMTLNAVNFAEPMPYWKAAAQAVVGPLGCTVGDVYSLDNRSSWEAKYTCDRPLDVETVVAAHKVEWRAGLTVADPFGP